jgi:glycosyltransferase involved in cell wall biosynthesis
VHAFWSRHVGLVLPLLEMEGSPCLRSAFVGAYDLVADDFILDLTVEAAEILFSHAEANRPILARKAPAHASLEIIRRGIPLPATDPDPSRDRRRLMTASALVPSKNVEAVIRSFAKARESQRGLTLTIFGDGPDRSRLERLARQLDCAASVTFGGHVPRDALFSEMQRSSIFLLLSKKPSERLPNVLKEALWAGCAVICSETQGIRELVPDPGVGLVVDPDNPGDIAAALNVLLAESPGEAEQRRERARALVAANYSSATNMRAYADAWRALISARQGHRQPADGSGPVRPSFGSNPA